MNFNTRASILVHDFIALIYPQNCPGCGKSLVKGEKVLCTICAYDLPFTNYYRDKLNPLARKLLGRIKLEGAYPYLFFYKSGIVQSILHHFKYGNQPEIGHQLGFWYGEELVNFLQPNWDLIVPVPLHPLREKRRGYNQSDYFASGLADASGIPWSKKAMVRMVKSETQTHKSKTERWENVRGIFSVAVPKQIEGKHILLVDDVITTGATLESCGTTLLESGAKTLSLASLALAR